ncbi:MAG: hypothetical protein AMXMBFR34_23020 [Myxococcaceae bacterium]
MTALKTPPTPRAFAKAWAREFEAAVKKAAGKDGRLSRVEASRMAEARDGSRVYGDTASLLMGTRKTASVSTLVAEGMALAEQAAIAAAGSNRKLSLAEGKKLHPGQLVDDFLQLRGRVPPTGIIYSPEQLAQVVTGMVQRALDNGTAVKLNAPPASVRGRRPVVDNIPHPASNTRAIAYVADHVVYISRASPVPSPLVGWYRVGMVP